MKSISRTGSLLAATVLGITACAPAVTVETAPPPAQSSSPPAVLSDMTTSDVADMEIRNTSGLTWSDLVVPGFPSGAKIAVLHGDPGTKGDYTLRLQFPDGYEFPVHWHPGAEHLTVLSGSFHLGMGGVANPSMVRDYVPGDFLYIPGRMSHFGGARGVTVIQLHGVGPFAINLGTAQ